MRPFAIPTRIVVPAVVLAIAAGVRLFGLASPPILYWDEQYYVFDAEVYLGGGLGQPIEGAPAVKIANEGTWVHPPLGKWIIALLGVGPLGNRPIGWRLPSALFGIAGVALLYLLALELWGSVWWAGMSALLLALDGLHIVQSRIAMLDVFVTTFITAGTLLLVLDRRRVKRPRDRPIHLVDRIFGSGYRLAAGAALGAAVATKWSGVFALVFGGILCATWSISAEPASGRSHWATAGTIAASFVLVPFAVYLLSYGAFFYQHGIDVGGFVTLQLRMLQFQEHYFHAGPEISLPWTWPLLLHPIKYFGEIRGSSSVEIVALGNPVFWWGFLAALPLGLLGLLRRRSWPDAVAFGGYAAMFLPWFAVHRSQFIFYMLPAVPFMALSIVAILRRLPKATAEIMAVALTALMITTAVAFMPAWTGWTVPSGWVDGLRLLSSWPR